MQCSSMAIENRNIIKLTWQRKKATESNTKKPTAAKKGAQTFSKRRRLRTRRVLIYSCCLTPLSAWPPNKYSNIVYTAVSSSAAAA